MFDKETLKIYKFIEDNEGKLLKKDDFLEVFPELTENKLYYRISRLEKLGYIKTKNVYKNNGPILLGRKYKIIKEIPKSILDQIKVFKRTIVGDHEENDIRGYINNVKRYISENMSLKDLLLIYSDLKESLSYIEDAIKLNPVGKELLENQEELEDMIKKYKKMEALEKIKIKKEQTNEYDIVSDRYTEDKDEEGMVNNIIKEEKQKKEKEKQKKKGDIQVSKEKGRKKGKRENNIKEDEKKDEVSIKEEIAIRNLYDEIIDSIVSKIKYFSDFNKLIKEIRNGKFLGEDKYNNIDKEQIISLIMILKEEVNNRIINIDFNKIKEKVCPEIQAVLNQDEKYMQSIDKIRDIYKYKPEKVNEYTINYAINVANLDPIKSIVCFSSNEKEYKKYLNKRTYQEILLPKVVQQIVREVNKENTL